MITILSFKSTKINQPSTGSAEFDGGVGVALFRPPASLPPPKSYAPGRPGVAEFAGAGGGKAAFASRYECVLLLVLFVLFCSFHGNQFDLVFFLLFRSSKSITKKTQQQKSSFFSIFHRLGTPSALESLRRYGLAGVLSYGILNTIWYAFSFATAWLYVAKVPRGAGIEASARAAGKVFALAWAGSQVTKAARIAGAALGAPLADGLIDRIKVRLDLPTRRAAFGVAVACCAAVAVLVVGGFVVAWS